MPLVPTASVPPFEDRERWGSLHGWASPPLHRTYPTYMLENWAEAQGIGEIIGALKRRSSTSN